MHKPTAFIHVGTVTAVHGVRGQVKIRSLLSSPNDLLSCGPLTDKTGERAYHIKREGIQQDILIVSIEGITDRNIAEKLKGTQLYAPADTVGEIAPLLRLVGMEARLADGAPYGEIVAVHNFGAGEIIEIAIAKGKTEMLPLNEKFAQMTDDKNTVIVHPPEYTD